MEPKNEGLLLNFSSPDGTYTLTVDDDGRVAYAYLKKGDNIVADVWLYNNEPAPEFPEWTDREKVPFANPREFVKDDGMLGREVSDQDVLVDWDFEGHTPIAYVYLFEDLYGVVGEGDKPGYARLAAKDGPLARVFRLETEAP